MTIEPVNIMNSDPHHHHQVAVAVEHQVTRVMNVDDPEEKHVPHATKPVILHLYVDQNHNHRIIIKETHLVTATSQTTTGTMSTKQPSKIREIQTLHKMMFTSSI